jgi:OstA-like protein.
MTRLSITVLAALCAAAAAGAQGAAPPSGRCVFRFDNTPTTRVAGNKLPSGQYNSFIGGGVIARCPAQNIVLRSDSLEAYGDEGRLYFVGNVDYVEPRLTLKSSFLTYFQRDERLLAVQNVRANLPSGSTLRGPQLEFFRAVPRVRPVQSATATGRPTVSLVQRDSAGRAQPPVEVTGNNIYLTGDSIVSAVGSVVVVRPELTATGDSLFANNGVGLLRLMRTPRIVGTKGGRSPSSARRSTCSRAAGSWIASSPRHRRSRRARTWRCGPTRSTCASPTISSSAPSPGAPAERAPPRPRRP